MRSLALTLGLCALLCGRAAPALAESTRILVAIGQNLGAPDDEPLRYAERDAEHFAQLLTSLGDVDSQRSYLVTDASAERVRQVLTEVRGRAMELKDVVLIVYVSGHADAGGLQLGASQLPNDELRKLVASIPARVSVLVVDACTSGTLIQRKGGKPVRPFAIDLESPNAIAGQVVISSTGPNEPAQEWEALGGALFTHHLMTALRGAADRDGDGRVTLFEAYSYTYDRTLAASSGAWAGAQHPSHDIELRGAGDLVLTRPGGRSSGLVLGAPLSGRYVITSALGGELIAEVEKSKGRALQLAVDPGRYVIRKPEGAFVRVGEVTVLPSSLATLDESELEQVPYAEVARRGAGPLRVWSLAVGSSAGSGVVDGSGITPRMGVSFERERGPYTLGAGFDVGFDAFRGRSFEVMQREVWMSGEARLRAPIDWVLPYLGLRLGVGWIHQAFTRDQERAIREVFATGEMPSRDGLAGQGALSVGLELPFDRVLLRIEGGAGLALSQVEAGIGARPVAQARIVAGWRL